MNDGRNLFRAEYLAELLCVGYIALIAIIGSRGMLLGVQTDNIDALGRQSGAHIAADESFSSGDQNGLHASKIHASASRNSYADGTLSVRRSRVTLFFYRGSVGRVAMTVASNPDIGLLGVSDEAFKNAKPRAILANHG
jgi:hypothetical protein